MRCAPLFSLLVMAVYVLVTGFERLVQTGIRIRKLLQGGAIYIQQGRESCFVIPLSFKTGRKGNNTYALVIIYFPATSVNYLDRF